MQNDFLNQIKAKIQTDLNYGDKADILKSIAEHSILDIKQNKQEPELSYLKSIVKDFEKNNKFKMIDVYDALQIAFNEERDRIQNEKPFKSENIIESEEEESKKEEESEEEIEENKFHKYIDEQILGTVLTLGKKKGRPVKPDSGVNDPYYKSVLERVILELDETKNKLNNDSKQENQTEERSSMKDLS